jgi:hypothetical protein
VLGADGGQELDLSGGVLSLTISLNTSPVAGTYTLANVLDVSLENVILGGPTFGVEQPSSFSLTLTSVSHGIASGSINTTFVTLTADGGSGTETVSGNF